MSGNQYNAIRLGRVAEIAQFARVAAFRYLTAAVALERGENLQTVADIANQGAFAVEAAGRAVLALADLDAAMGFVAPEITDADIAAAMESLEKEWEAMGPQA